MSYTSSQPMKNGMFTNPLIVKLSKVHTVDDTNCATYRGIAAKVFWFLICIVAGVAGYFVMSQSAQTSECIEFLSKSISKTEILTAGASAAAFILVPLLAFLIRPLIPILGSLFCAATGYLISFAGVTFGKDYLELIWMALIITMVLVCVMAFLYSTGIIRVGKKFRAISTCLFICAIFLPIIMFIMTLIPATAPLAAFIQANIMESAIGSVIFIIIGCMMLISDFSGIQNLVENGISKKYEWLAAFSLAYTVIWLYFKVLDLLMKLKEKEEN